MYVCIKQLRIAPAHRFKGLEGSLPLANPHTGPLVQPPHGSALSFLSYSCSQLAKSSLHKVVQDLQCPYPDSPVLPVFTAIKTQELCWAPSPWLDRMNGLQFYLGPESLKLSFILLLPLAFIPCLEFFKSLDKHPYLSLIFSQPYMEFSAWPCSEHQESGPDARYFGFSCSWAPGWI